ncbi:MAG: heparinase, partial [Bacteroidales bacterium]|nr:heparinase [Bacteroidales bacterium]
MKRISALIIALLAATLCIVSAQEAQLKTEVFDLIDMEYQGLAKVKKLHSQGRDKEAAAALLDYYRSRQGIRTPEISNVKKVKISKEQQKWADEALV